jgi:hypothetical protein
MTTFAMVSQLIPVFLCLSDSSVYQFLFLCKWVFAIIELFR